jgi:hypothetical protein
LEQSKLDWDFKVVMQLLTIFRTVTSLCDGGRDTKMLAGSKSYVNALTYYNSVQLAKKKNVGNAETVYDDLKVRFETNGKRKKYDFLEIFGLKSEKTRKLINLL